MKIWRTKEPNKKYQEELSKALNISSITAQILFNRGIDSPGRGREFLTCHLDTCHDPYLLKGIDTASERIKKSISRGEKILVYGDYDVDGISAVCLLYCALRSLGANVDYYIPNRLEEGYGLNLAAIKAASKKRVSLLITADCGITSYREIDYANELGIDVIVTDHHEIIDGKLPDAYAIINPLQADCRYPFKHLAGVGIVYKLAKVLLKGTTYAADDFLDLVSLGTVADISPQIGENRVLTRHGLGVLSRSPRTGLRALIDASGLSGKDISSGHVGFILGPRINAMGRIGSAEVALRLLLEDDELAADELAAVLNTENRNRQKIEGRVLQEALEQVTKEVDFTKQRVIVLANKDWHQGVIGIVASRLVDRFYRPTILISLAGKIGKGSGRSIERFHIFEALAKCRHTLLGFGGHECACGITIEKDRVDEFREAINEHAFATLSEEDLLPKLTIDIDIDLSALREKVVYEIESLAPFGPFNPRPILSACNLVVKDDPRPIGKNGFKMFVTDRKTVCEAVSFGREALDAPKAGQTVDLAFIPSINTWQGLPSIQLELKDIHSV